eukprot:COSAG01_NODE_4481_length_4985_cov_14.783258_6_plen_241_part_00
MRATPGSREPLGTCARSPGSCLCGRGCAAAGVSPFLQPTSAWVMPCAACALGGGRGSSGSGSRGYHTPVANARSAAQCCAGQPTAARSNSDHTRRRAAATRSSLPPPSSPEVGGVWNSSSSPDESSPLSRRGNVAAALLSRSDRGGRCWQRAQQLPTISDGYLPPCDPRGSPSDKHRRTPKHASDAGPGDASCVPLCAVCGGCLCPVPVCAAWLAASWLAAGQARALPITLITVCLARNS